MIPEAFVWFLYLIVFVLILALGAVLEAYYRRHTDERYRFQHPRKKRKKIRPRQRCRRQR